jgi:hypothetical protein
LKKNYLDITRVSQAAIRYGVSNRAAAAIATATLASAKDANLLKKNTDIFVDHNKIKRSKTKLMKEIRGRAEKVAMNDNIQCIFFDGRKDLTKYMREEEDGKLHPSEKKEEHYSVCSEPGGKYQFHFTNNSEERVETAAEQIAGNIYEWVVNHDVGDYLVAIGADSTNLNTGWKGGVIHYLEHKLDKKLMWIICALHTNELPLRHLMIQLDGKTTSKNNFSGSIGKLIGKATSFKVKDSIVKIEFPNAIIELDSEVVKSLSDDQKYLYKITHAINAGVFPENLKSKEIGPHSHARWLNFANRICLLWCSEIVLSVEETYNLQLLVEFIVGVYAPLWFEIKVKWKWTEGPNHILKQLKLLCHQRLKVKDIVMPYVLSSSWNAHSENVLQTLLCSLEKTERQFAVETILKLRGDLKYGNTSVRSRKHHIHNENAESLFDLIDWSLDVHEPLLTCLLSKDELLKYNDIPMYVPCFPVHGQAIERCVQEVTRASQSVFGKDRRDGFIRATLAHREIMPVNQSKKDLFKLI